jgi:hypothetical protein
MKWNKNIEVEKRNFLSKRLHEYEAATEMTKEERKELREWVTDGHDPFDNPWNIYGENGWPMDYIQAMHEDKWMCEHMKNLTPEELESFYQEQENAETSSRKLDFLESCPLNM